MNDTIAAVSTSSGAGAIGIIRMSGPEALTISSSFLFSKNKFLSPSEILPRTAIQCVFQIGDRKIDQILFFYFKSPNSYTGEDLCEFHFHGNPILLREALDAIFRAGARPAKQGEFSRRAFLNEKLDLTEVEAIGRLISARSRFELELAQKNVFGEVTRFTSNLRSQLISLKAECEAEIDFSTEDLTYESLEERKTRIENVKSLCQTLISKSSSAEKLIQQFRIVLYGEPNTGKSSLMNVLLGKERSIISEIPGTTRDYISEEIFLEGIPVRLVDTAGVRETTDHIEKLGIERSEKEFQSADVRLFLVDVSKKENWKEFINKSRERLEGSILIANKIDILNSSWDRNLFSDVKDLIVLEISCKTKEGISNLLDAIKERTGKLGHSEDYVLLEERQRYHFETIVRCLDKTLHLLKEGAPAEIYIQEINYALAEIGEVNGKVDTEEVLGRIFSKFCVGK
ncbi:tRNA uridine-5-carboxymethylaminomethyl(34) synthesis GTPase MnmE [Leptospira interrogans]|uniref:tRNA modification GTPase MnmE n=5 Tax=Leptospira interrogans TaxID=173 RepID=MNME_LEPIC|nr:tRNA uridine-5-carboxymethylaminomethyl(34) synthesis GTPase MnmE [Leptospira interrogans]Q72VY6.1 RecName: Full=tRNA modification GTPase MnmE [Leptospira interrogans serovar Copenhageni str. Fiocruz L1-130]APH40164.1 tRNA modification GTPase MnmE [Leptospira interrogans serovar Copenhageni/Icterohaemorrhagiae]EMG22760.1 tRNA modification GTPase TrmE [Leptospira interrogans serovar Copenhageni str. LT2050]OCC28634.1 tRNA modification GTPase MnmE [Leptospira interrogans serovar Canicola]AAS6